MQQNEETPVSTSHAARQDAHGKRGRGNGIIFTIFCAALFGGLLFLGLKPRLEQKTVLDKTSNEAKTAPPMVTYVYPKSSPTTTTLDLPGNVAGAQETAISARATGYVKKWFVDIGDHVKAGQILAVIETPDADQSTIQAKAVYASSVASAQQAKANTYMQIANQDQALANVSKAEAAYDQSKSDLAHSQAAEAQAQQQADQAKAQLVSGQASLALAKKTSDRYQDLVRQGAVDQQTADQDYSAYLTSKANVDSLTQAVSAAESNIKAAHQTTLSSIANEKSMLDSVAAAKDALIAAKQNVAATRSAESAAGLTAASNNANYQRTAILQGFQNVVAPFDGVITARNVDVGSLVSATGGVTATTGIAAVTAGSTAASATNTSLFDMVRTNTVLVYVSVPETLMGSIRAGQAVGMTIAELGDKPIVGTVDRDSTVLDQSSRTLLTQIDVPNPKGLLRPGMYATVKLTVRNVERAVRIPDTALIVDSLGTRVAVVDDDNKIHFKKVIVGRDYGKDMDITDGLSTSDKLVSNPTNLLTEGSTVHSELAKTPAKPGAAPSGASPAPTGAEASPAANASAAPLAPAADASAAPLAPAADASALPNAPNAPAGTTNGAAPVGGK